MRNPPYRPPYHVPAKRSEGSREQWVVNTDVNNGSAVARRARGPGIFSQQIDVLWRCLHGRGRPLTALFGCFASGGRRPGLDGGVPGLVEEGVRGRQGGDAG